MRRSFLPISLGFFDFEAQKRPKKPKNRSIPWYCQMMICAIKSRLKGGHRNGNDDGQNNGILLRKLEKMQRKRTCHVPCFLAKCLCFLVFRYLKTIKNKPKNGQAMAGSKPNEYDIIQSVRRTWM